MPLKPSQAPVGLRFTDKSRKGDLAEQWVALLATWKGAEVFKNINCTGKTDLVIKYNGRLYQIDVKLAYRHKNGAWDSNTAQVKDPVIPVIVIPDGDISDWRVQWVRNRHPLELKDFWNKQPITFDATQKIEDDSF